MNANSQYHNSRTGAISLLLLILVLAGIFAATRFQLEDDAYISYRYAYNLAQNGELVFNSGERVEGITNLLWTLLLSIHFSLFDFPIEQSVLFLSLCLIVFITIRIWQMGKLLHESEPVGILAALLLILNPEFIGMATNGLEGALFSALLLESIYRYARDQFVPAFVASSLLFITRPEGVVPALFLIALVYWESRSLPLTARGVAIVGGVFIAATLFRLSYYGTVIPNSVVAKSFDVSLLIIRKQVWISYFTSFLTKNPYLSILFAGAVLWLFRKNSHKDKNNLILMFCIASISFSFIVAARNGGDWMDNHRLLLQYGTLYSVLLILLVRQNAVSVLFSIAFLVIPFLQTVNNIPANRDHSVMAYEQQTDFWAETTKRLQPVIKPTDVVSAEALGYISYYLIENQFHDPVGLTDPYLARNGTASMTYGKHDSVYTVDVIQPSVMVWHDTGHMKGLDQSLLDNYEVFCAANCQGWSADVVMIRRDRLPDLSPAFTDWQKIRLETDFIGPAEE